MLRIGKAAVLGAGTMGAAIAAHLTNAGIPTLLLDIAPDEATDGEKAKGLTSESEEVRNRIVREMFEAAKKLKPAPFMAAKNTGLIELGNFQDDMHRIGECDLVIEAVVERLDIKHKVFAEVEKHRKPGSIIASNTSGIPICAIAEPFSDEFKSHFLGTHFFNPPRYMKLVEVIPTEWTKPEISCQIFGFLDQRLGKGVVAAKDEPNFIANRVGTFGMMVTIHEMLRMGFTPTEVDQITGKAIGHAKSATFRTSDLVGLDVLAHVNNNLYPTIPNDEDREAFVLPDVVNTMLEKKILGDKTGGGFYKKSRDEEGNRIILELDLETFEYKPQEKSKFPSLEAAKQIEDRDKRIKKLVWGDDRVGEFLWRTTSRTLRYAANRIPEIADSVRDVDNAMKWGFGWEIGVFETWDAIGVEESVERMKEEEQPVPDNIQKMLENGAKTFYKSDNGNSFQYDLVTQEYKRIEPRDGVIDLQVIKDSKGVIKKNSGASLIDLGDGVACLEFHTKMNSIGADTVQMINAAIEEVEENFAGLVIGNQGGNFSAGANIMLLLLAAQEEEWDDINLMIAQFQKAVMRIRYSSKPVVTAPFGLALGGGCEVTMHGDAVRAAAETYIGLVEVGVGLIPAGAGTKELTMRTMDSAADVPDADPLAFLKNTFELIGMGKVATSAQEAKAWGILKPSDTISMNGDRLIADAKQQVLNLAASGYVKPVERKDILVLGESAQAAMKLALHMMKRGGFISDHDEVIGKKLAKVMAGGDLNHETRVSESYLIDLEREAFLSLCGEPKTQQRIAHMLKTGKPLRN
ncbi:MAG: 3-hydroxyacyl-CoA dehydrogenase/enoyl-CoA hydratase family protein [Acidobacteria bacterium]|nr:MAG: 3-hydroxyacyl-CoA dehydrogenase/enoyl-CoA hydratase family protein [Acidobacteriota bacterium]REK04201.1 MAG: 3-hydroxyacyl-CoA dehydrogenase/enoyl-CoA hydratase family protein [Acidobacteriota bacterium]REK15363.1 MAG: 3-hydroxyacyl-CoA dehydrogenase/enoyl-CoA hydratase family protein [Acidobacteriota bacterium]REK46453.1 MAG: 3-hydroxyacyl-CoA dehydrogenase/enoyl-CoA hydratase family protein [Acidobacteriota bacterium]